MEVIKHLFIVNPVAGQGSALSLEKQIRELLEAVTKNYDNTEFKVVETKYPGHATKIARDFAFKEKYRIYSVGGDGTLNEVINGMVGSESSLGVIPGGTGNDFIKSISPDFKTREILKDTILGYEKKVDLGKINDRYFHNILSIGFDAEVNVGACKYKKWPLVSPKLAYIMGIGYALTKIKPKFLTIEKNGIIEKKDTFLMAICNGTTYGGEFKMAPNAKLDDGLLDIVRVDMIGINKIMKYLPSLKKGDHYKHKEIESYTLNKINIYGEEPLMLNIDGEIMVVDKAEITCEREVLNLIYPGIPNL